MNKMKNTVGNRRTNQFILKNIYIISMIFAFTTRYADVFVESAVQISVGIFWIGVAGLNLLINKFKVKGAYSEDVKLFLKLYLTPHILIHMYSVMLMCMGKVSWSYFTTGATVYVPSLLAIVSIYLFGTKALYYNCIAMIGAWVLSVGVSLIVVGPHIFRDAILQGYFNIHAVNYLELHDIVLSAGYIMVMYIYIHNKLTLRDFFLILFVLLIMFLGIKRISAGAIIFILLFAILIKRLHIKNQYKICVISAITGVVLCYIYVYILIAGNWFFDMMSKLGINLMGRNYYFAAIANLAEFKLDFLGIGRNGVARLLSGEYAYLKVGGVHNDILKMYVENGFIMFGLWLIYYIVYLLQKYKKIYGLSSAVMCFLTTVYTFYLYATDNTEVYFMCQIFSILVPATYALRNKQSIATRKSGFNYAVKFNK